jgi:hypothetical protein
MPIAIYESGVVFRAGLWKKVAGTEKILPLPIGFRRLRTNDPVNSRKILPLFRQGA